MVSRMSRIRSDRLGGWRRRRKVASAAVLVIFTGLLAVTASPANPVGTQIRPGVSQPEPCPGKTCLAPCVLRTVFYSCESRDPDVTLDFTAEGAGCNYRASIDWGDSKHETVNFTQPPGTPQDDEPSLVEHHRYRTGAYAGSLTVIELASAGGASCVSNPIRLPFEVEILDGHYDLVAMGDSFSAGEGTFDYDQFRQSCHRSPEAWPRLLRTRARRKVQKVLLLACSGANSKDLSGGEKQPDQLALLHAVKTNLVTVTISGNDVDFAGVLRDCYLPGNCVHDGTLTKLRKDIEAEKRTLVDDYLKIAAAAPGARILVVDYPELFPPVDTSEDFVRCHWLKNPLKLSELSFDNLILDGIIETAVDTAENDLERHGSDNRIDFVEIEAALNGHGFCTADPWVNDLIPNPLSHELGHPTVRGQEAMADAVARYINSSL